MIRFSRVAVVVLTLAVLTLAATCGEAVAEDGVEFLNGTKASGKILGIRKADKEFDFQTVVGGKQFTRTYPYAKVHAVTLGGKRFELTPLPAVDRSDGPVTRTSSQVLKLIEQQGNEPPDWFEPTPMVYPPTLDLSWPIKPGGKWDNRKNVGQYIWDVINPNDSRWKSGIKLVHHCMSLHRDDPTLLQRDMNKLATMYFTLTQDYARAAFWYKKANVKPTSPGGVRLAECYWRLGNKGMAQSLLRGRAFNLQAIKLFGDMGELEQALRVTAAYAKTKAHNEANLAAGDALRKAGRNDQAIDYYTRVLNADTARNKDYDKRFKARARGSIEAIRLYDQADVRNVPDGTYRSSSTGYNGPLEVEVTVADSAIRTVRVTDHKEKQYYAALTDTAKQIIQIQGIVGIDGTSGATITSQAIVHATAKALAQGSR